MDDFSVKTAFMAKNGNALSEYGLVGAMIVLVCIAGFLIVGGNLKEIFSDLRAEVTTKNQAAVTVAPSSGYSAGSNASPLTDQQAEELLEEITEVERNLLQQDLQARLQTVGANGTTELAAKQIALLASKLLAEGKISPEQSGALMQLANQGHKIAGVERMIEDAVRITGGDKAKLNSMTLTLDGYTYSPMELASQIGFNSRVPSDFTEKNILEGVDVAQYHMRDFLNIYKELESTGVMAIPEVQFVVENAASEIAATGESMETVLYTTMEKDAEIASFEDFNNKIGSNSTDINSSQICKSGKFNDDGRICRQ